MPPSPCAPSATPSWTTPAPAALAAPGTAEVLPVLRTLAQVPYAPGHLTITVDGPHLVAGVPPVLLERIVSPLLANACRYAVTTVTVRAHQASDGVRVDIMDDGPGVPPPFAARLFEPGRRADPGDGHGGAGLGLPLARRLARSAGGEVTYDSEHAPGARFVVSLPAG
jgi:signal transduction histidine kinase